MYWVYCGTTKQVVFEGTLQECYREIYRAAPYGIYNPVTQKTVCVRTINGFRLPAGMAAKYPRIQRRLERNHMWY